VLLAQLNIGGILVIPVGDENTQKMVTILKTGENDYEKIVLDTFRFVPLVGEKAW
jgi:protein-L-isoaspartate(D-aspartate) O-methyltransferase